jgi:hypothetical protein
MEPARRRRNGRLEAGAPSPERMISLEITRKDGDERLFDP